MSEWMVVTALVTLVGLIVAVVTPIVKLNTTITKLNTVVESMQGSLSSLTTDNAKSHRRIWEELDEHGDKLNNHETRITVIEKQGGK